MPRNPFAYLGRGSLALILIVAFLGFLEVGARHYLQSSSQDIPPGLLPLIRPIYMSERNIIQLSKCAQYDDQLTYTLSPGVCSFDNLEFSTEFSVNRLGLRDDEESLKSPKAIVLGDSHAMGWGISENNTFSDLVEAATDTKVLNAAISSYATARQCLLFQRLDTSDLQLLIVQYCPNDYRENALFARGNFKPMSEKSYQEISLRMTLSEKYWPGKHIVNTARIQLLDRLHFAFKGLEAPTGPGMRAPNPQEEVHAFLTALKPCLEIIGDVPILVFEIEGQANNNTEFLDQLKSSEQRPPNLVVLDLHDILTKDHYYILDDHLNSLGHKVIADSLLGAPPFVELLAGTSPAPAPDDN